jgi:hypothetical protein
VCADIAFGLGARIEGWSTRPQEKAREERRRKKKKPLASHHHRRCPGTGDLREVSYGE